MTEEVKRFANELDALLHHDRNATDHTSHLVDEVGSALNAKLRKMKMLETTLDECEVVESRLAARLRPALPLRAENVDPLGRDIGPMPRVVARQAQQRQTPPPVPPEQEYSEFDNLSRRHAMGF